MLLATTSDAFKRRRFNNYMTYFDSSTVPPAPHPRTADYALTSIAPSPPRADSPKWIVWEAIRDTSDSREIVLLDSSRNAFGQSMSPWRDDMLSIACCRDNDSDGARRAHTYVDPGVSQGTSGLPKDTRSGYM